MIPAFDSEAAPQQVRSLFALSSFRIAMFGMLAGSSLLATHARAAEVASDANEAAVEFADEAGVDKLEVAAVEEVSAAIVADADIATVVVSTRNRLEKLQDVPVSVSVVEGTELTRLIATDMSTITQRAANISWNQGNSRTSSLSIRGIGKQAQTDAQDPSVGIIVDGLAYAYNPLSSFDFTDIEAVEVTRGPQGTLLGKNATLGVLNIRTRRPSFTPDAYYSIALGQNDRVIGIAAGGGPVTDKLAWRGAFSVDKGDGDYSNAYNEDFSYKNKDNVSGRVQFLYTPTDNFDALVKLELQPRHAEFYNGWVFYKPTPATYSDGTPTNLNTDASTRLARRWFRQDTQYSYENDYLNSKHVNLDAQQPLVTSSRGATATLNWRFGEHTLTSVSGYKDFYFQARNDEGTPFDASKNGGGHVEYDQISQELRLSSPVGGAFDYQAGVYFLKTSNDYDSGSGYGSDAGAWFATPTQYDLLDKNSNGRYLMENSLNGLNQKPLQKIRNETAAVFGQTNWHISEPLTLTTGLRFTQENRRNRVSKLVYSNGYGSELNPVQVNGVQLGGFATNSNGRLTDNANSAEQLALADATANKYFGVASYNDLSDEQFRQIAAAKAIRQSQIGVLWNEVEGETFKEVQPTYIISPSYRINEQVTTYLSYQYGEKAGIAQVTNGYSNLAKPEKNSSYEVGVKTALLDNTLTFNIDVFLADIDDYQQAVFVLDEYTSNLNPINPPTYISATGNADKVRTKGVEIDAFYSGIQNTTIRFSGAYNDAYYRKFTNLGQPPEVNLNPVAPPGQPALPALPRYRDVSGQNLPGAAKWTGNVGIDYRLPILNDKELHLSGNYAYTSRYNSDITLSSYGWTKAYGIADAAIGVGTRDGRFEASLIAKNVFDEDQSQVITWNSWIPVPERWLGVVFTGRL